MSEPVVSVIVPVRNGRAHLPGLVASLEAQTLPRELFEVIVADDGSTDGSTDDLATADGWIRVTPGQPQNSYAARNRAAGLARAPVLAFCDADCRPEPDWLEAGLAALEETEATAGLIRFSLPERRTIWTLLDLEMHKDHESQVRAATAETANLFVHRHVFDRIDGFDDSLPEHGDFDFATRVVASGGQLTFTPEAVVWHPTRDRAKPFLRNVWIMTRWQSARETRDGTPPRFLRNRFFLPLYGMVRSRRSVGFSLLLDRRRLAARGVMPSRWDDLRALPIVYVVLPYVAGAASWRGWRDGRRLVKARA